MQREVPDHAQTDPSSRSRGLNYDNDIQGENLERFSSPEPTVVEDSEKSQHYNQEKHVNTDGVPLSNDTSSSGYNHENDTEKKKRHHLSLPGFLGGKKNKEESAESDDDNNGKAKKKQHFTAWGQFRATVLGSWVNVLLIFCEYTNFSSNCNHS